MINNEPRITWINYVVWCFFVFLPFMLGYGMNIDMVKIMPWGILLLFNGLAMLLLAIDWIFSFLIGNKE